METITYIQVQQLIKKLPETKLSLAYRLLLELIGKEVDTLSPQADFMRLSLDERRRILAQQAEQMKIHYEQTADERSKWQSGDFIDTLQLRDVDVRRFVRKLGEVSPAAILSVVTAIAAVVEC